MPSTSASAGTCGWTISGSRPQQRGRAPINRDDLATAIAAGRFPPASAAEIDALLDWLVGRDSDAARAIAQGFERQGVDVPQARHRVRAYLDQRLFSYEQDPYRLFGLTPGCDLDAIRQRHKWLLQVFHPDRHSDAPEWFTERSGQLNRAWAWLKGQHGEGRAMPTGGYGGSVVTPPSAPAAARASGPAARPGARHPAPPPRPWFPNRETLRRRLRARLGNPARLQRRLYAVLIIVPLLLLGLLYLSVQNEGGDLPGTGLAAGSPAESGTAAAPRTARSDPGGIDPHAGRAAARHALASPPAGLSVAAPATPPEMPARPPIDTTPATAAALRADHVADADTPPGPRPRDTAPEVAPAMPPLADARTVTAIPRPAPRPGSRTDPMEPMAGDAPVQTATRPDGGEAEEVAPAAVELPAPDAPGPETTRQVVRRRAPSPIVTSTAEAPTAEAASSDTPSHKTEPQGRRQAPSPITHSTARAPAAESPSPNTPSDKTTPQGSSQTPSPITPSTARAPAAESPSPNTPSHKTAPQDSSRGPSPITTSTARATAPESRAGLPDSGTANAPATENADTNAPPRESNTAPAAEDAVSSEPAGPQTPTAAPTPSGSEDSQSARAEDRETAPAPDSAAANRPEGDPAPADSAPDPAPNTQAATEPARPLDAVMPLLNAYQNSYAAADIDRFAGLFAPGASATDAPDKAAIRRQYHDMFQRTARRRLHLDEIRIRPAGGQGYRVAARYTATWTYPDGRTNRDEGALHFELTSVAGELRITRLEY